jgi:hypothetical protein
MLKMDQTEQVYEFIWNYVTERKTLSAIEQIAEALDLPKVEIEWCVQVLRYEGWVERRILADGLWGVVA